tara:strand:- start:75 stop:314 length:240 start_codon:yes stop_codon:yes gene_type:complete
MSDLWIAYLGFWKNENLKSRVLWETSRYISFVTLKSVGDKKMKNPMDLMLFPWEEKLSRTNWTASKLDALKKLKPKWFN